MLYINNINIFWYIGFIIAGFFMGQFSHWCNVRMPEYKKIFSKEIVSEFKTKLKPNYILGIICAIIYVVLLYRFGISDVFIENFYLIQCLVITPLLLSVFCIDMKLTIIPNRLNLTLFEIGLISTFAFGLLNFNIATDSLKGMLIGGGVFLLISLIGGLIAGKEAMGFGDVKLMGALGLIFGSLEIIIITAISFLIGAIISIIVMIVKRSTDQYIPFGPFIIIATFLTMIIPNSILYNLLIKIFTLGLA